MIVFIYTLCILRLICHFPPLSFSLLCCVGEPERIKTGWRNAAATKAYAVLNTVSEEDKNKFIKYVVDYRVEGLDEKGVEAVCCEGDKFYEEMSKMFKGVAAYKLFASESKETPFFLYSFCTSTALISNHSPTQ